MNAIRIRRGHQFGAGHRYLLAEIAAAALAAVLLSALYFSTAHSSSQSLDKMPPTSAIAKAQESQERVAQPARGPIVLGGATFHEGVDLKDAEVEPDPSPRAVAAY